MGLLLRQRVSLLTIFMGPLAMIGARSSVLAMDNLVGLKFDKQQNRMSKRPFATDGAIKPIEVIILIIQSLYIFIFC